ncbi:MAG: response regulator transcription factor [Cyclobacteriaceae bacterium]|nr:response regulator transcription factor [Cyclobacteriaceae bacterium]
MVQKVVLVEDEKPAVRHLESLLKKQGIEVLAQLDSVKSTAKWLANNPPPELLLMDIQLGDGLSFEVFDIVKVNCPVIFVTAFNEYAIEAFKLNSIAYLLKPIQQEYLLEALNKFEQMKQVFSAEKENRKVLDARDQMGTGYKSRFILKVGAHLKSIPVEEILYFFSQDKATFIKTKDARSYVLDNTLEQVQSLVNPHQFFRIGRKYLVHINSIEDIVTYTNSRLLLKLTHLKERDAIVSREKVNEFKLWLDR